MTRELRWRIITLQVVMVVVLAIGAGLAFWGNSFTNEQIRGQLEPQMITFPADVSTTVAALPADLQVYAPELQKYQGQQVLNGEQAHVYAEGYLGLHLRQLADGKVYSQLSTEARTEKDPVVKEQKNALVMTAFRGETLRSMLNQAWAFSIIGTVALYAAWGLVIAAAIVGATLVFELTASRNKVMEPVSKSTFAPTRA